MNPFIEARHAGLSPFPVRKGTKIPAISWKQFQSEICSEMQAIEWGGGDGYSIGIVTGEVSGRLMAIDIEAAFMPRIAELAQRMRAAGVGAVFDSWVSGYSESTPRGGLHILVRLEGEGPCPRNDVFARDDDGKVLIETRGEGGYVLVAPSPGYQVTGGGYEWIVYCTLEEWAAVEAVLRGFDVSPQHAPTLTVPTRSTVRFEGILGDDGPRWINEVKANLPPIRALLEQRGWVFPGSSDDFGEHCVRPGKNPREGHSANLSRDGYLWIHSTNTGLPVGVGLDAADLMICWETGQQTAPSTEERTGWLKAQRPTPAEIGVGVGATPAGAADLNLPTDFWQARPYLTHIHQAALSLRLSPDAVWEAIKCFYAATIPWNHRLPGDGTFDYVSINVGEPGAGKSRAQHAAWQLLEKCYGLTGIAFPCPAGSGEGMTDIYLNRDTNSKQRYKLRGVGFYADEGKFVLDIASRAGNTTIQAIKQMWSGELTGSVAASVDRHRWLEPRAVRGTLLISTTPDIAARFMAADYTDEGLPQRLSWAWAHYPHPDNPPNWPGPLNTPIWDHNRAPTDTYTLELHPDIAATIDKRLLTAARGQQTNDGLEGHATYAIEKCAGIHAHLDGRLNITTGDWTLATTDWEVTRTVRQHITRSQLAAAHDRNTAAGIARAHQKIAETNVYLEKAALSLVHKLQKEKTPLTMRQIKDHLRSYQHNHAIHYRDVITLAIERGLVDKSAEGVYAT